MMGPVHRAAVKAVGNIELVAGAFSSTRPKSRDSGKDLGLSADRVYGIYRDMFRAEAKLPEGDRIDFVSIVTPTNMHYPVAMAAVDAGFHVISESPMASNIDEAENLERKLEQTGKLFCLTEHHAAYPMVEEARRLIDAGKIGAIRRVVVEYPQGWLSERLEARGQKQAAWRTNPRNCGASGCMSHVASHAFDFLTRITGLSVSEVSSDLTTFVNGRMLDDDGSVLLRFDNGSRGVLWASQVALCRACGLRINVYGEKGSIAWQQDVPGTLMLCDLKGTPELRQSEAPESYETPAYASLPYGHPPIFIDPLVTLYQRFAQAVGKTIDGETLSEGDLNFPRVQDGIKTAHFVAAVVSSASSNDKWVKVEG